MKLSLRSWSWYVLGAIVWQSTLYPEALITFISPLADQVHDLESYVTDMKLLVESVDAEWILVLSSQALKQKKIIELLADNHPQIRIITRTVVESKSSTINSLLPLIQSDYLAIADPHDRWNHAYVRNAIDYLETHQRTDVVYADQYMCAQSSRTFQEGKYDWIRRADRCSTTTMFRDIPGTQAIWRRSLHDRYGLFDPSFEEQFRYEFWMRALFNGARFDRLEGVSGVRWTQAPVVQHRAQTAESELEFIHKTYRFFWDNSFYTNRQFVVVIASYNNSRWWRMNLDSVLNQQYDQFRVILIDDCSTDGMSGQIDVYLDNHPRNKQVTYVRNNQRLGALHNIYNAVWSCRPDEIVVIVDGDDWLANGLVLRYLNGVYQDPNVWLTYGQFKRFPKNSDAKSSQVPPEIIRRKQLRTFPWVTSHLRTFYAGLFHKIQKKDLLYQGRFFPMTGDLAIMFPMVEMAGEHSRFIPDILYVYNTNNSLSDHRVDADLQERCAEAIRTIAPYPLLHKLF